MKTIWMTACIAVAANAAQKPEPDLVVFLHSNSQNARFVSPAERLAQRMLAGAGISADFRIGKATPQGRAEIVDAVLVDQPDDTVLPGALAFATLHVQAGTRIEVFFNRVQAQGRDPIPALAHVLVHEITHLLEGVNRHSEVGVMKAHWDREDWRRLRHSPLPFADEDLRLLHAWVEGRSRTLVALR